MTFILHRLLVVFLGLAAAGALAADSPADKTDIQRAVLITGASTGIGRLTAERLAAEGHFVYAGARKPADIKALNAIENVQAVKLDVTVAGDIDAAVATIRAAGRGLWGIVNNAGVNLIDPLIEADESDLQFLFDVNVYGVFRVTRAFAPLIVESGGRIVNISSISGILSGGLTGYGMYFMSKHAVEAFSDQLAFEMAPLGVHVSAVEPGSFQSDIGLSRCRRMLSAQADKRYEYFAEAMAAYRDQCRGRLEGKVQGESPPPDAVADAISHALFSDTPKQHYLVVPDQFQAMITMSWAFRELLHLNHDQPYSYSREELIELMDEEWAILKGEKQRDWPVD